jgi:arabinose-5-phosphate isomerase
MPWPWQLLAMQRVFKSTISPGTILAGPWVSNLYLTVEDFYKQNEKPQVDVNASIREVILEISSKRLGATAVSTIQELTGIITDGDLRRMLQSENTENLTASDIMSPGPKKINKDILAVDALQIMRDNHITQLLVMDGNDHYLGMSSFT